MKDISMACGYVAWAIVSPEGALMDIDPEDKDAPRFVAIYSTREDAIKDLSSGECIAKVQIIPV